MEEFSYKAVQNCCCGDLLDREFYIFIVELILLLRSSEVRYKVLYDESQTAHQAATF